MREKQRQMEENTNYQGRSTSRKNSNARRIALLEAALRIIARDGARGVRHRAVAAEADVPLAATTYYFEHIEDLINDAFVLFYERMNAKDEAVGEFFYQTLASHPQESLSLREARLALAEQLAQLLTQHIAQQSKAGEERILEYAFRSEALFNPLLRELVEGSADKSHQLIVKSLRTVYRDNAAPDARIMLATIQHLEYQSALAGSEGFDTDRVYQTLLRLIQKMLHCAPDEGN
jgi:DNA-binding transcriptional regulator YbjK